jgi:hypothetical protein
MLVLFLHFKAHYGIGSRFAIPNPRKGNVVTEVHDFNQELLDRF